MYSIAQYIKLFKN